MHYSIVQSCSYLGSPLGSPYQFRSRSDVYLTAVPNPYAALFHQLPGTRQHVSSMSTLGTGATSNKIGEDLGYHSTADEDAGGRSAYNLCPQAAST